MVKFHIQKEPLQPQFMSVNINTLGEAAGSLKLCGLKLYLYLMTNADGFTWTMNPSAYANWLGVDYVKSGRTVRKAIEDGIMDLKVNGFIEVNKDGSYVVQEQFVPKNHSSSLGTICSSIEAKEEQKVPDQEQIVPFSGEKGTKSTKNGTICSDLKGLGF